MASVAEDELYAQKRRQQMLADLSHMGVDDELLRDVLMKVRARRARIQQVTTPQPNRSYRGGLGRDAEQKQAPIDAGKTKRYTFDPCCMTFRCLEMLGTGGKRRQSHLRRYENTDEQIPGRFTAHTPNPGGSVALLPERSLQASSMTRNILPSASSVTQSRLHSNYNASMTEGSHPDFAWANPGLSTTVGSPNTELSLRSNKSFTSTVSRRSARIASHPSNPPDMSSTLNPNFDASRAEGYHISQEDRTMRRGRNANSSSVGSPSNGLSKRILPSPATSITYGRTKQVPKVLGTICTEGLVCPDCAAKYGLSNELATNPNLRSMGNAQTQNKQSKPKMKLSRLVGLGSTAKQSGLNPIESNSPHDSQRMVSCEHTCNHPGIQSRSHGIQQEGLTRRSLQTPPTVRSLNNALPSRSQTSLASTKRSGWSRGSKPSSPRDTGYIVGENGKNRRFQSAADSVSTLSLSLPSTSTTFTKNSIVASEDLNPSYPDAGYDDFHEGDGDGSSQESLAISREVGKVVDSIRSTARDVLSSDVENVWLSRDALEQIAESKEVSVDALIDSVCDRLGDLDDSLFQLDEKKVQPVEPAKPWLPRVHLSVNW